MKFKKRYENETEKNMQRRASAGVSPEKPTPLMVTETAFLHGAFAYETLIKTGEDDDSGERGYRLTKTVKETRVR